jgi:hypothetical protein
VNLHQVALKFAVAATSEVIAANVTRAHHQVRMRLKTTQRKGTVRSIRSEPQITAPSATNAPSAPNAIAANLNCCKQSLNELWVEDEGDCLASEGHVLYRAKIFRCSRTLTLQTTDSKSVSNETKPAKAG